MASPLAPRLHAHPILPIFGILTQIPTHIHTHTTKTGLLCALAQVEAVRIHARDGQGIRRLCDPGRYIHIRMASTERGDEGEACALQFHFQTRREKSNGMDNRRASFVCDAPIAHGAQARVLDCCLRGRNVIFRLMTRRRRVATKKKDFENFDFDVRESAFASGCFGYRSCRY